MRGDGDPNVVEEHTHVWEARDMAVVHTEGNSCGEEGKLVGVAPEPDYTEGSAAESGRGEHGQCDGLMESVDGPAQGW